MENEENSSFNILHSSFPGERQGVSPPSNPHGTALPDLQSLATYRMNENHWLVSDHSATWQNAKNRTRRAHALPLADEPEEITA